MRIAVLVAASTSLLGAALVVAADQPIKIPAYVSAAVADESRPDSDRQRDVNRKPADVLAFAGVKPGDKVGELMPGRGYYTKLLCKVVGEKGSVKTLAIQMAMPRPAGAPPPPPPETPRGTPCTNVSADTYKIAELQLPSGLDVFWTSENYHDLPNPMFGSADLAVFNKKVYEALRPGGIYIVEDHNTAAGAGKTVTDKLHRIEKSAVIADVTAAGFKLDGDSHVLENPADDHSQPPFALKGTSDKFLLKFRKPK